MKFLERDEAVAGQDPVLPITNRYAFATEKYLGCIPPPVKSSKGKCRFIVNREDLVI